MQREPAQKAPPGLSVEPVEVEPLARVLGAITAESEPGAMMARALEGAERVLSARGGFVMLSEPSPRIAHYTGIDQERLRQAATLPTFRQLLAENMPTEIPASNPVALALDPSTGVLVGAPLIAHGKSHGRLMLLLPRRPDPTATAALGLLAGHLGLALTSAMLTARLADRGEQLSSVAHSLPNPIVVVDDAGNFTLVNGAASMLFNLAGAFDTGKPVGDRLGPVLGDLLARNVDENVEVALGSPPRLYRAASRRVRSARGAALGRVLVLDDITTRHDADRLKSDFIAVIGHELRTPLTVIRGYASILSSKWQSLEDEQRGQAITALDASTRRLERLIEGVLFVAAIEDRNPPLDLHTEDVGKIVDSFAEDERVSVKRPEGPIWRFVDAAMVEAIVHQLVENALKYSDGPVVIDLIEREAEIEIGVSDEGDGIFSGDIPLLFNRFQQLDSSSTRRQGGMGIGLYISRRLVEGMGGHIRCDSRLGVGSRFSFTIPLRAELARPS